MPPVPIFVDTDMSIDVDDVGALCVAHALADAGEATLLAVVHSTAHPKGVGAIASINQFYERDVPVGAYRGPVGREDNTPSPAWTKHGRGVYVDALVAQFPARLRDASDAPDALDVYLDVLGAAADGSVVVVCIGHTTNLLALLRHTPLSADAWNSSGLRLIERKVSLRKSHTAALYRGPAPPPRRSAPGARPLSDHPPQQSTALSTARLTPLLSDPLTLRSLRPPLPSHPSLRCCAGEAPGADGRSAGPAHPRQAQGRRVEHRRLRRRRRARLRRQPRHRLRRLRPARRHHARDARPLADLGADHLSRLRGGRRYVYAATA